MWQLPGLLSGGERPARDILAPSGRPSCAKLQAYMESDRTVVSNLARPVSYASPSSRSVYRKQGLSGLCMHSEHAEAYLVACVMARPTAGTTMLFAASSSFLAALAREGSLVQGMPCCRAFSASAAISSLLAASAGGDCIAGCI